MIVDFDPVALRIFGWPIHWYGLMYLVGFVSAWWIGRLQLKRPAGQGWTAIQVDDMVFYGGLGVILGGRIGYILFYNFNVFISDPLMLLRIWQGGMSFHGGLLGVMLGLWFFNRKYRKGYFTIVDYAAPMIPLGLGCGRIGNFINAELWGKPTDLPWAMIFPAAGPTPRHPTPLYEALLEGLVLFIILWAYTVKPRPTMAVSGMFALFYALFRILVEFVRLPDAHIGYLAFGWVTMGMLLSLPLMGVGVLLLWLAYRKR
ncbi:MAG: prolipoprotein diacylglyceryl transferase [Proteobacteria bacterium]|jgi:phosphatidylglycerol---prolipoprotein diacylglyceryl transferase|nr:prolipoprotein diacylglyceryl transferase [Pseudomonadota bacterium]